MVSAMETIFIYLIPKQLLLGECTNVSTEA